MSSQAQAAVNNLQVDLMETLPFIAGMQAPQEFLKLLLDDFLSKQEWEATDKSLKIQLSKDAKAGYAGGESEDTTSLREHVKKAKKKSEEAEEAVTLAFDKHYRNMSRTLHPDRNGEDSRAAFELLTKAKDCLQEADRRHLYLEQMLQVAQISPSLVDMSHANWVKRNFPDQEPMPSYKPAPSTLFLEGGIVNNTPRRPIVSTLNIKQRRIQITMRVRPNFCEYCIKMYVIASCADYEKDHLTVATLEKDVLENFMDYSQDKEIRVSVEATVPVSGIWDIKWYGTLLINEQNIETPHSKETRVDLTSNEQKLCYATMDENAKRHAEAILTKLDCRWHGNLEIHLDALHKVLARGQSTLNDLLELLRTDGSNESHVKNLGMLREALQKAVSAKESLEAQFNMSAKKNGLKSFERYVVGLLESGEAASWLRTLDKHELESHHGDANRLYQLLVEGTVHADAATLEAATTKLDLFSGKQCKALHKCKIDAEEQIERETQRAVAEAKAKREEEKKLDGQIQEMHIKQAEEETQHKAMEQTPVKREPAATTNSVTMVPPLPNQLPPKASSVATGQSWSCAICTFLHEGARASMTGCNACRTPRGQKVESSYAGVAQKSCTKAPAPHTPAPKAMASREVSSHKRLSPKATLLKNKPCIHGVNSKKVKHVIDISHADVGALIGRKGVTMKKMVHESGAKIRIVNPETPHPTVHVIGSQKEVELGVQVVKERMARCNPGPGLSSDVAHPGNTIKGNDTTHIPALTAAMPPSDGATTDLALMSRLPNPANPVQIPQAAPQASPRKSAYLPPPPPQVTPQANAAPIAANLALPPPQAAPKAAPMPNLTCVALSPPKSNPQAKVGLQASPSGALSISSAPNEPQTVIPSPTPADLLLSFLKENKGCLKGSLEAFFHWLSTQDITTPEDLADAVSDDEYQEVLQKGDGKVGVKVFKFAAFKRAAIAAAAAAAAAAPSESKSVGPVRVKNDLDDDLTTELICPISHVLMTDDPVLAADGYTYERSQIDAWFQKQQKEIEDAKNQIASGSDSQQARGIIERGVLSPLSHEMMPNLNLVPNNAVRTMARDAAAAAAASNCH